MDLQRFCGTDETRPYLLKPFTRCGKTYATDGRIVVRIPPQDGIGDVDQQFNVEKPFEGMEVATFEPLPAFELSPDGIVRSARGAELNTNALDAPASARPAAGAERSPRGTANRSRLMAWLFLGSTW